MELTLAQIAAAQYGLITRPQVLACGGSERVIEWRMSNGLWVRRHRNVYALKSHPRSFRQDALAASFAAGEDSAISHLAAGRLHGLAGFRGSELDLTTEKHVRIRGVTVHRARLNPDEIVEAHRIPVTSLLRTLVDVAPLLSEDRCAEVLDEVLARGVPIPRVLRSLTEGGARRRAGTAVLRRLLAIGIDGRGENRLETRLYLLLVRGGVKGLVRQHRIYDGEQEIARIDIAIPHVRIAIESDGRRAHFGLTRWIKDTARATLVGAEAWFVLRFTWNNVHNSPEWVVREVKKAVASAEWVLQPTVLPERTEGIAGSRRI